MIREDDGPTGDHPTSGVRRERGATESAARVRARPMRTRNGCGPTKARERTAFGVRKEAAVAEGTAPKDTER